MNFVAILPESILFIGALFILMFDVFLGKKCTNPARIAFLGSLIFSITSLVMLILSYDASYVAFNSMFFVNKFTSFVKIVAVALLTLVLFMSHEFVESEKRVSAEFAALLMIATTGAMLLISSNDLLPFYMSLELQSLSLYILAAIKRDSLKSSESGMKYFLLGSVASGILLLGISMIYGFSGTTNFSGLFYIINSGNISIGILLGFTLILAALLFKISAVPFHMWSPDVYEGAPTIITTFFASAIKFIFVLVLTRIYISIINIWTDVNQILIFVAILSLLVGSLGAIRQNNLKRLLAYSGISHIGFILSGLSAVNVEAINATIIYMVIYSTLSLGSFAFLLLLKNKSKNKDIDSKNDQIYQLTSISGIAKKHPLISLALAILMFSMAGIPPLAGFFAKFYILLAIITKELYFLAIIAVMSAVISAFYYIRIVKIMYFDEYNPKNNTQIVSSRNAVFVLMLMALLNLLALTFLTYLSSIINNILV